MKVCVLAYTLFGIFFATLLKHAFGESTEDIYLQTRSDGNLFKLSRLRAKTRVHEKYARDLLFAYDAAITTHTQEDHQQLLNRFSDACRHFGLHQPGKNTGHGARHSGDTIALHSQLQTRGHS